MMARMEVIHGRPLGFIWNREMDRTGRVLNPFKNSMIKVDTSSAIKVYLPVLRSIYRMLLFSDHVACALDHMRLILFTSSRGFLRAALSLSVGCFGVLLKLSIRYVSRGRTVLARVLATIMAPMSLVVSN